MTRCHDCDRPLATQMDYDTIPDDEGEHLCWRSWSHGACSRSPEDWRARALAAEAGCARRDLAIEALTARVAEVMADCDRLQGMHAEVSLRLFGIIDRHSASARRVAAYVRKLRLSTSARIGE